MWLSGLDRIAAWRAGRNLVIDRVVLDDALF